MRNQALEAKEGDWVEMYCPCGCEKPMTKGQVVRRPDQEDLCIRNYDEKYDCPLYMSDERGMAIIKIVNN